MKLACICDGYEGLTCDVAGEDCALRQAEAELMSAETTETWTLWCLRSANLIGTYPDKRTAFCSLLESVTESDDLSDLGLLSSAAGTSYITVG